MILLHWPTLCNSPFDLIFSYMWDLFWSSEFGKTSYIDWKYRVFLIPIDDYCPSLNIDHCSDTCLPCHHYHHLVVLHYIVGGNEAERQLSHLGQYLCTVLVVICRSLLPLSPFLLLIYSLSSVSSIALSLESFIRKSFEVAILTGAGTHGHTFVFQPSFVLHLYDHRVCRLSLSLSLSPIIFSVTQSFVGLLV